MAVVLRLTRFGKKHRPFYRVVAVDKRKKRDGRYIDAIGLYDPLSTSGVKLTLNEKKFTSWQEKGALPSEGLTRLLKNKKATRLT